MDRESEREIEQAQRKSSKWAVLEREESKEDRLQLESESGRESCLEGASGRVSYIPGRGSVFLTRPKVMMMQKSPAPLTQPII